jgi:hypothetical protein
MGARSSWSPLHTVSHLPLEQEEHSSAREALLLHSGQEERSSYIVG